jgi:PTH1 family peptidyl-tRNA hydrolase
MRLPTKLRRPDRPVTQPVWLVVGLGNPGPTYAGTRHNAGAMAVAALVAELSGGFATNRRARADVFEGRFGPPGIGSVRLVAAVPRSFMNESGGPVASLADFYKVANDQLIVAHDELDLPLGSIRLKLGGGDNGHNGLKSIRKSLGTGEFYRVRLGIGRPPGRQDPAEFVLRQFTGKEREEADLMSARAAEAIEVLATVGLEQAQNRFNS